MDVQDRFPWFGGCLTKLAMGWHGIEPEKTFLLAFRSGTSIHFVI